MHNENFPKIIHIKAFELIIGQPLSNFNVLYTCEVECALCNPFCIPLVRALPTLSVKPDYRRSDSQNSPQIIAQEKGLGMGQRLQHKECITIRILTEFSPSPKYIFVNRKKQCSIDYFPRDGQ